MNCAAYDLFFGLWKSPGVASLCRDLWWTPIFEAQKRAVARSSHGDLGDVLSDSFRLVFVCVFAMLTHVESC